MKLIRKGKVKEVYQVDDGTLEFVFSDNISVFDKIIPSSIPHKGETLCRTAQHWFRLLDRNGIKGHLIEYMPPNRMRVKRFDIIEDYDKINTRTSNYLIPLEVICRHYAAGSLMDRIKSGKIDPGSLGFPKGHKVVYGEKLPRPYLETTTKLEATDRELEETEAKKIAGLTDKDYKGILDTVLRIDNIIGEEAAKRGLIHVDGKKEFGYNEKRELVVIDTFGTCDEDRWWDLGSYNAGKVVELSKEFVRQHYRETGYHAELMAAREKGVSEPPIPALPQSVIEKVSELYVSMFERITGEKFR
ncbi:MAG: phosphoribosylaminoimidazolesuccinocarboxamide synthase [Methanomassiliicoccaceae archaeon]|jgi:phosphoribosylaminoimidazole-succinocarboxamide synthase|nr:phosphoribosylaminoimidazolesuccinocarboxamide synthase [Methanomassiliicoccaceae archaeon]